MSSKNEGIEIYKELFKNKTFCQPQNKHERPIIDSNIKKIKDKETGETKKVEINEYGTCIECGYPLVTVDHHRSERVCECGVTNKKIILLNDIELEKNYSKDPLRNSKNTGYTEDEKRFFRSQHKKVPKTFTPKPQWRKSQHIMTVESISSQLMMTRPQINRVKEIIDTHSLHLIHSRVNSKIIIAGICRYVLLKDGRGLGNELRFNRQAFKFIGLNSSNYNVIKLNLQRLGI